MRRAGGLWLLFVAVLAVGVVLLVGAVTERSRRGSNGGGSGSAALTILEERFARCGMDQDELEQRRRTLQP